MKRVYKVADLLKRKMLDYGYRTVDQMAAENGINVGTLYWLIGDKRQSNQMHSTVFHQICKAFDIAPAVLYAAIVRGWECGKDANHV